MKAALAIQCHESKGKLGSFLFDPTWLPVRKAVSPVFDSLVDLYDWCRVNDWQETKDPTFPCGAYTKQA
jgi:hypothetical protein